MLTMNHECQSVVDECSENIFGDMPHLGRDLVTLESPQHRLSPPHTSTQTAIFDAIVAVAFIAAHHTIPSFTDALYSGKRLEHCLFIEITSRGKVSRYGYCVAFGPSVNQLGMIVLVDFIGEYIVEVAQSKPRTYLQ